eukprot:scaffold250172_cov39-Tisochrysis_lutea.AAC.2
MRALEVHSPAFGGLRSSPILVDKPHVDHTKHAYNGRTEHEDTMDELDGAMAHAEAVLVRLPRGGGDGSEEAEGEDHEEWVKRECAPRQQWLLCREVRLECAGEQHEQHKREQVRGCRDDQEA